MVRNLERSKDEALEENDNKIANLLEHLDQTQEMHNKSIQDKDAEISDMKDEFQMELDKNNEFVLEQINKLKEELAQSRYSFIFMVKVCSDDPILSVQFTSDVWNVVCYSVKQHFIGFRWYAAHIQQSSDYKTSIRSEMDPARLNRVNRPEDHHFVT